MTKRTPTERIDDLRTSAMAYLTEAFDSALDRHHKPRMTTAQFIRDVKRNPIAAAAMIAVYREPKTRRAKSQT